MLEYREPSEHQVCIHFCRNRIEIARSHSYKVMLSKSKNYFLSCPASHWLPFISLQSENPLADLTGSMESAFTLV